MGGSSKKQTVGYKYYLGMHMAFVHGPVDKLELITVDGRIAWRGSTAHGQIYIDADNLFGGEKREGGISGFVDFESGKDDQTKNSYLQSQLGDNIPAFRRIACLVLRQCYLGINPYLKKWAARLQRIHTRQNGLTQWYNAKAAIAVRDSDTAIDFNHNFLGTQGGATASTAPGVVTVSGMSTTDYLIIEIPENPTYKAFSFFPSDAESYAAGHKPWATAITVFFNGAETTYNTARYDTQDESLAYARQNAIYATGATEYKIYIKDDFASNNRGGISVRILVAKFFDMNPAHIIRECLTDPDWGMGYQDSDINDTSFAYAADFLFGEGMGISILWDRQGIIEDFIKEILRHINASLFVDRATGKFTLKLIRDDFNESSLITLNESNIEKVEGYSRPAFGELTNSITVNYWENKTGETGSVTVQDTALIQLQQAVIGTTISFPGFTNHNIASRAAMRSLQALSIPLLTATIYANRDAENLNIGDVFKFEWPDYHDGYIVMRITGIAFGDGRRNVIRISCIQDVFNLPSFASVSKPSEEWQNPSVVPSIATNRVVVEAPYFELVQRLGQANTDNQLSLNPDLGYVLASAARPTGAINATMSIDAGAGYEDKAVVDFSPFALLTANITPGQTVIAISSSLDLDLITVGTHGQIGNELIRFDAVSDTSLTIGRGVLDTVPAAHSAGTAVLAWDAYARECETEYVAGETLNVKLLPSSGAGVVLLADAPADSLTFASRAYKPYPPGNVKVNTVAHPVTISGLAELTVSWSHRDRLQQTAGAIVDTTYGNIGPESGTTYTLEIYNENNSLVRTVSGLTGTSYNYPAATEASDSGLSNGGDANYANVITLLNFPGANNSTTITDEKGRTWTPVGNAKIDTSLGYNALLLDGSGDYISTPKTDDFDWFDVDYTMEAWINPANLSTWAYDDGGDYTVMLGWRDNAGANAVWGFGPISNGALQFRYYTGTTSKIETASGLITNNNLVHIEMSKIGSTIRLFVGGILRATGTKNGSALQTISNPVVIGQGNNRSLNGRIKAVRMTKGVGKHTTDFTPPPAPFPDFAAIGRDFNGKLRFTLKSVRGSYSSFQKHDYTVSRTGYGFNYGERYGS